MSFKFKTHSAFKINGEAYTNTTILNLAKRYIKTKIAHNVNVGTFLLQWFDENETLNVSTSGSTGSPKIIALKKEAMINSALATGQYFQLKAEQKALLCLPSNYIAGKMMIVRAMVLGLDLYCVAPSSNPLKHTNTIFDFCAMVPLQVEKSLAKLNQIKTLIIGGAKVSHNLANKLKQSRTLAFETYGMTETCTHIAIKSINETVFNTLPNITITSDNRQCLVINAPKLLDKKIATNDIVQQHSKTSFEILGRFDNIINSGGIKLIPEQIEAKLKGTMPCRFFICAEADEKLGQRVIIVLESVLKINTTPYFKRLDTFEIPKKTYYTNSFIETGNGKIQRKKTFQKILRSNM